MTIPRTPVAQMTRAQFIAAVEDGIGAAESLAERKPSFYQFTPGASEKLREVAKTIDAVAIGNFRLSHVPEDQVCGCPLYEAHFANEYGDLTEEGVKVMSERGRSSFASAFDGSVMSNVIEQQTGDAAYASRIEIVG